MDPARVLRLYYDESLLARAKAGEHNYTNRMRAAVESRGLTLKLCRNTEAARLLSAGLQGYALFHMDDPFHPRSLTTRLAYFYPFWRIESSAKRWEWEIAKLDLVADAVDPALASKFAARQRKAVFGKAQNTLDRTGYVYVPLQGRLLDHRSFQTMSPLDMLGETLAHSGDRPVVAGLHPREIYSAAEIDALEVLIAANPRLSRSDAPMADLLRGCRYVVTQNSSVALAGYLVEKPAILFAFIDFHHIALNVADLGLREAFHRVQDHRPDFAAYLYWFLKETTINAGAQDAETQILAMMRKRGWIF